MLTITMHKKLTHLEVEGLLKQNDSLSVHDEMSYVAEELFDIEFPQKKDNKSEKEIEKFFNKLTNNDPNNWGSWFYYPWLGKIVHVPPVEQFRALRTSRNRNLVTKEEQEQLYNTTILVAGLSVGSNIVEALVSQGIGGKLVLADMDVIEPSNLNRIRSPYHHVGLQKTEAIAQKSYEIDPYLEIVQVTDGVSNETLAEILESEGIDVIVDEIDDLPMKIAIRKHAKAHALPVVMAADDGDNSLVEIERFDENSELPIFNNRIPEPILDKVENGDVTRAEQGVIIGKYFVGFEHVPLRMFESLVEVGKTLPSWPQLGGAATLSGVAIAYIVKRIVLGQDVLSGQTLISLDEKLTEEHKSSEYQEAKQAIINKMQ